MNILTTVTLVHLVIAQRPLYLLTTPGIVRTGLSRLHGALEAPIIWRLQVFDGGFEVHWQPVDNSTPDQSDTLYKVLVWEQPMEYEYKWVYNNGTRLLVNNTVPVNNKILKDLRAPLRPATLVAETKNLMALVTGLRAGISYEVRVRAFADGELGQMSEAAIFKIN